AETLVNPTEDPNFVIEDVAPGDYRVIASGLPENHYVESFRVGGQPLPRGELRVRPGQSIVDFEVRLGSDGASVEGEVLPPEDGELLAGLVALVPDQYGPGPLNHELLGG